MDIDSVLPQRTFSSNLCDQTLRLAILTIGHQRETCVYASSDLVATGFHGTTSVSAKHIFVFCAGGFPWLSSSSLP